MLASITFKYGPGRQNRKPQLSLIRRQQQICSAFLAFGWQLGWDYLWRRQSPKVRRKRARWLMHKLLSLGPTFIKIGQFLSTRIDLLPPEYIQALSELQDRVPPFSSERAIATIEESLGHPLNDLYADFEADPLAAASLGQVHRARLHSGEEVVVKVQRPNLEAILELDYRAVGQLVRWCDRHVPHSRRYELESIYEEFFSILFREIDYIQEGENADRFRENFAQVGYVTVPKIYWEYTARRVLTMEYLPGIRVDNRAALEAFGLSPQQINQQGICCYLKQLLQDGFFHADPHPGNLAVSKEGDLIFYDYGMMTDVAAMNQDQMVRTFFAVMKKDAPQVIITLTELGLITPVADMAPVQRVMQVILDRFTERPVDVQVFTEMQDEVYALFEQQPFRLPAKMTYILKSLTTLDGIARSLDPEYNLTAAAQPFVKTLLVKAKPGQGMGELARQTRKMIQQRLNQPSRLEQRLQTLEERLERGEISVQIRNPTSDRQLRRLERLLICVLYACISGFTLLAGALLILAQLPGWGIFLFMISGVAAVALIRQWFRLIWPWR